MPVSPPPFLLLTATDERCWNLAAGVLRPGARAPKVRGPAVQGAPTAIAHCEGETLWRVDLRVPRGDDGVEWEVEGTTHTLTAPPLGAPLRLAFVSCDGTENMARLAEMDRNAQWHVLSNVHGRSPFHVILHGGDQIYADGVENAHPELAEIFLTGAHPDRPLSEDAAEAAWGHYWHHYTAVLRRGLDIPVMAEVPSVMIWDDHDVYDGFGSHPDRLEGTRPMRDLQTIARQAFFAFQRLSLPAERASLCLDLGGVGLVLPDLRGKRTETRACDELELAFVRDALDRLSRCRRIFCLPSVPLIGMEVGWVETVIRGLGLTLKYSDDLRDQFCSQVHQSMREALLDTLADHAARTGHPVDLLSGEIHMAGHATARDGKVVLHQFISSGITHPPPPPFFAWLMGLRPRMGRQVGRHRTALDILPGHGRVFAPDRNWLSLEVGTDGACIVHWHFEDGRDSRIALSPSPGAS